MSHLAIGETRGDIFQEVLVEIDDSLGNAQLIHGVQTGALFDKGTPNILRERVFSVCQESVTYKGNNLGMLF